MLVAAGTTPLIGFRMTLVRPFICLSPACESALCAYHCRAAYSAAASILQACLLTCPLPEHAYAQLGCCASRLVQP